MARFAAHHERVTKHVGWLEVWSEEHSRFYYWDKATNRTSRAGVGSNVITKVLVSHGEISKFIDINGFDVCHLRLGAANAPLPGQRQPATAPNRLPRGSDPDSGDGCRRIGSDNIKFKKVQNRLAKFASSYRCRNML